MVAWTSLNIPAPRAPLTATRPRRRVRDLPREAWPAPATRRQRLAWCSRARPARLHRHRRHRPRPSTRHAGASTLVRAAPAFSLPCIAVGLRFPGPPRHPQTRHSCGRLTTVRRTCSAPSLPRSVRPPAVRTVRVQSGTNPFSRSRACQGPRGPCCSRSESSTMRTTNRSRCQIGSECQKMPAPAPPPTVRQPRPAPYPACLPE